MNDSYDRDEYKINFNSYAKHREPWTIKENNILYDMMLILSGKKYN